MSKVLYRFLSWKMYVQYCEVKGITPLCPYVGMSFTVDNILSFSVYNHSNSLLHYANLRFADEAEEFYGTERWHSFEEILGNVILVLEPLDKTGNHYIISDIVSITDIDGGPAYWQDQLKYYEADYESCYF